MNKKNLFKVTGFLLLLILILSIITQIVLPVEDKTYHFAKRIKGFYNEEEDSLDVVFIGSSHAYYTMNPWQLWEEAGITSYVFASPGQPIWISYYYMKEVLKTQSPKVIVVDVYKSILEKDYEEDKYNAMALEGIVMSQNKIRAIQNVVEPEMRMYYYLPIIKYHERWKEIIMDDFTHLIDTNTNYYKGWVSAKNNKVLDFPKGIEITESKELTNKNLNYLEKIIQLSKDEEFELVLVNAPYQTNEEDMKTHNKVEELAKKYDIPFINYNKLLEQIEFDFSEDMKDIGHVNYKGSQKVTKHLLEFLLEQYEFEDRRNNPKYYQWHNDYKLYTQSEKADFLRIEKNMSSYIDKLRAPNHITIVATHNMSFKPISSEIQRKLFELGVPKEVNNDYIAIYDGEELIYQQVGKLDTEQQVIVDNLSIIIKDNSEDESRLSSIKINNQEVFNTTKGVRFIVYDKILKNIVDNVCFTGKDLNANRK